MPLALQAAGVAASPGPNMGQHSWSAGLGGRSALPGAAAQL